MNLNQRIDVGGKSLDEVLANSEKQLRQLMESNLLDYEDMLRSYGATPTELSDGLAQARANLETSIAENLLKLRDWLARGGETLN